MFQFTLIGCVVLATVTGTDNELTVKCGVGVRKTWTWL